MSWISCKLGDICNIARGGSPRPIKKFITEAEDGINWIKIGDATRSKKYIYETREKIKKEGASHSRFVNEGDFLLSNSMSFGRPYIMRTTGCIHDGWLVLSKYQKHLDVDFFYHLLSSPVVVNQFEKLAQGSTVRNLNKELVSRVEVKIPPLATQQKIVAKLDAIVAEIDKATAAAEANAKSVEALFQSYLRSTFNTENLVKLSSITKEITDGDHQAPPKAADGVPFITISNVNKVTREIDFSRTFKVSKEYFNALKKNRKPMLGDVLYTVTGSFGIPIHVNQDLDFCFQRHIGLIRPSERTDSKWLFWLMLSPQIFQQASDTATGAAQLTVSLKAIRNFNVPLMTLDEQKEIVTILDSCFNHVRKLQNSYTQKVQELNALKQAILKQAFNGELVKD